MLENRPKLGRLITVLRHMIDAHGGKACQPLDQQQMLAAGFDGADIEGSPQSLDHAVQQQSGANAP